MARRFLAEAQSVTLRRGPAPWSEPHDAAPALVRMAAKKQRAFTEGALAAGRGARRFP